MMRTKEFIKTIKQAKEVYVLVNYNPDDFLWLKAVKADILATVKDWEDTVQFDVRVENQNGMEFVYLG